MKMTKVAMIEEMLNANYRGAWERVWFPRNSGTYEKVKHYLQYHVLKNEIERMYENFKMSATETEAREEICEEIFIVGNESSVIRYYRKSI